MSGFVDTAPDLEVHPDEYRRLLGFPRGHELEGRPLALAAWARDWYAEHGRPWTMTCAAERTEIGSGTIRVDGESFQSERLAGQLHEGEAHRVILAAVSAGPELEQEAHRQWEAGFPDRYFFLETYGSAVVEHLVSRVGATLCARAETRGEVVLPHYSPGYPGWSLGDQAALLQRILAGAPDGLPSPLEALETGMLRPKKSLLAVFGVTRAVDRVRRVTDLVPCQNCSYTGCTFRRAAYQGRPRFSASAESFELRPNVEPLARDAVYSVNRRALRRWAGDRLTLAPESGGGLRAVFRYDGTTCNNLGQPLAFQYEVRLGPRGEGYPILEQHCGPAPGDTGHTYMCSYRNTRGGVMEAVGRDRPLLGCPLNDVLTWQRPSQPAGCYCKAGSRLHKWGIVLETIHYALAQQEKAPPGGLAERGGDHK